MRGAIALFHVSAMQHCVCELHSNSARTARNQCPVTARNFAHAAQRHLPPCEGVANNHQRRGKKNRWQKQGLHGQPEIQLAQALLKRIGPQLSRKFA